MPRSACSVVNTWVQLLVLAYPTMVLFSRGAMLWDEWSNEAVGYTRSVKTARLCAESHDLHQSQAAMCLQAEQNVTKWPIVRAASTVLAHTYSCGNYHCSDVFHSFTNTWLGIIVAVFFACVAAYNLLSVLGFAAPGARRVSWAPGILSSRGGDWDGSGGAGTGLRKRVQTLADSDRVERERAALRAIDGAHASARHYGPDPLARSAHLVAAAGRGGDDF